MIFCLNFHLFVCFIPEKIKLTFLHHKYWDFMVLLYGKVLINHHSSNIQKPRVIKRVIIVMYKNEEFLSLLHFAHNLYNKKKICFKYKFFRNLHFVIKLWHQMSNNNCATMASWGHLRHPLNVQKQFKRQFSNSLNLFPT